MYLTQFASKVYIIMRRDVFRADKIAIDAAKANPKIQIIQKAVPKEVLSENGQVGGRKIADVSSEQETILPVSGIFPYIGADPVTDFLKPLGVLDEHGYMIVNESMETSVPLLYGAGDVCQKVLRQVVTAANDGAIAAQNAFHKLKLSSH